MKKIFKHTHMRTSTAHLTSAHLHSVTVVEHPLSAVYLVCLLCLSVCLFKARGVIFSVSQHDGTYCCCCCCACAVFVVAQRSFQREWCGIFACAQPLNNELAATCVACVPSVFSKSAVRDSLGLHLLPTSLPLLLCGMCAICFNEECGAGFACPLSLFTTTILYHAEPDNYPYETVESGFAYPLSLNNNDLFYHAEPDNYYYETVECGRRCLLTGALGKNEDTLLLCRHGNPFIVRLG